MGRRGSRRLPVRLRSLIFHVFLFTCADALYSHTSAFLDGRRRLFRRAQCSSEVSGGMLAEEIAMLAKPFPIFSNLLDPFFVQLFVGSFRKSCTRIFLFTDERSSTLF